MMQDIVNALIGGALIGISATLLLRLNGKIAGISGIFESSLFEPKAQSNRWKILFTFGLVLGGLILKLMSPEFLTNTLNQPYYFPILGGLLVGFGTRLGGGCTSGHGVCGISRFSKRSIIATLSFMLAGMLTVALIRQIFEIGGPSV